MSARPGDLAARPHTHDMGIYKHYFDLIASGQKSTEIRVTTPAVARSSPDR